MHQKRALQVAVAGILSLGITVAQAGTMKMVPPPPVVDLTTETAIPASDLVYAYEQFDETRTTPQTSLSYPFRVVYKLADNISSVNNDFYVTATLSEGAAWDTDLQQPNMFKLVTKDGNPSGVSIARANGGAIGETSVTYLVAASKKAISKDDILDFNFKIRADKPLSAPGGQVQLTMQINLATGSDFTAGKIIDVPMTIPIATSAEAMTISITGAGVDTTGTGYISVEESSQKFTGTAVKDNGLRIDYGTITLKASVGTGLLSTKAINTLPKATASDIWDPKADFDRGILTIKDGNFNASGPVTDGNVYVEVPAPTLKIKATTLDLVERKAEWELKAEDLKNIYGGERTMYLVVLGTIAIDEFRQLEPVGTFQVKMKSRSNFIQVSSKLRHLKKNGTVCTLYNIPNPTPNARDRAFVRLTNDSTSTGFVKGRLRNEEGKDIYSPPYEELATGLGPNQTVVLDVSEIAFTSTKNYTWTGRAVLTVESNIPDGKLQVYGLLRAAEGLGPSDSPLMNQSTGATGNGCDQFW